MTFITLFNSYSQNFENVQKDPKNSKLIIVVKQYSAKPIQSSHQPNTRELLRWKRTRSAALSGELEISLWNREGFEYQALILKNEAKEIKLAAFKLLQQAQKDSRVC